MIHRSLTTMGRQLSLSDLKRIVEEVHERITKVDNKSLALVF
jgi:hypothetical protein